MTEERVTELEIKLAYQEDLLQTLNNIVCKQQEQIGRLEMTCKVLGERIQALSEPVGNHQDFEIPPHY